MLSKFGIPAVKIFLVLLIIHSLISIDRIIVDASETPEYKHGFQDGYNEQNYTKYQAADEIASACFGYTDAQCYYAKGYRAGYFSYLYDNYSRVQAEQRNETAKILGV